MSITAESIYDITDAPPLVARRFGAESVIDFADEAGHADVGIQWESIACGFTQFTEDRCVNPGVTPLAQQPCADYPVGEPFAVYGLYTDSLGTRRPIGAHETMARQRFEASEQFGLELGVRAMLTDSPSNISPTPTPTSLVEAVLLTVGAIEASLMLSVTQVERTIWMNAQHATLIGSELIANGGVLRTRLGSKVAVLAPDLAGLIYGTSAIKGHRGGIDVLNGTSVAREDGFVPTANNNDPSIIVQRTYAIGTACDVVSASVPATA